ncbi:MAG: fluoride efflux transporter CrcB [Thermomicrobiales bacterium]|nr:fluoride efflux transporter CrcB [Thermomicrobiales bacterium]
MATRTIPPLRLAFAVGIGGSIGAVARYGVIAWLGDADAAAFPWDTLAVNLLGSLLIGLFFRYWRSLPPDRRSELPRLFFVTGVLGGFTTFSTLSLDTVDLVRHAAWSTGLLYIAASLIGGLILAAIGYGAARRG